MAVVTTIAENVSAGATRVKTAALVGVDTTAIYAIGKEQIFVARATTDGSGRHWIWLESPLRKAHRSGTSLTSATTTQVLTNTSGNLDGSAPGGGGGSVNVNGSGVTNPNFNASTPAAPGDGVNARWQVSGSSVSGNVPTGSSGSTVCVGNDARLSDARTPTSHASTHNAGGGDALAIDAAAGTGSFRTLGTGAQQACAGNDSRLSDARAPTSHASTHNAGGGDALAIDAAAGTGSFRTLGTGGQQACAGNDSRLSDARAPTAHRTSHEPGGSDALQFSTTQRIWARNTAGGGALEEVAISTVLDWIANAQGSVIYRGASGWVALAPGTAGQLLATGGAAANPSWATSAAPILVGSSAQNDRAYAQASIANRWVGWIKPLVSTTREEQVLRLANSAGTISTPALATTNIVTQTNRWRLATGTSANTVSRLVDSNPHVWRGNAAGFGGFFYKCVVSTSTSLTNQAPAQGLTDDATNPSGVFIGGADPSNFLNCIFVGHDDGDTNWNVFVNDGSGTCTKGDLGSNFPARDTGLLFECEFFAAPNGGAIDYYARNLSSGQNTASTFSSNLPADNIFMKIFQFVTNNGSGTPGAAQLDCASIYLEAPF